MIIYDDGIKIGCACGVDPWLNCRSEMARHRYWHKTWLYGLPIPRALRPPGLVGQLLIIKQTDQNRARLRFAHEMARRSHREGGWDFSSFSEYLVPEPSPIASQAEQRDYQRAQHHTAYLWIEDDRAIAHAVLNTELLNGRRGLSDIWVSAAHRRKGVATRLFKAIVAHEDWTPAFFPMFSPGGAAFILSLRAGRPTPDLEIGKGFFAPLTLDQVAILVARQREQESLLPAEMFEEEEKTHKNR